MKDFKKNIKDYLEFKEISFKLFLKIFAFLWDFRILYLDDLIHAFNNKYKSLKAVANKFFRIRSYLALIKLVLKFDMHCSIIGRKTKT